MERPSLHECFRGNHASEMGAAQLHLGQRWVAAWRAPEQQAHLLDQDRAERRRAWNNQALLHQWGQSPHPHVTWCEAGAESWGHGVLCGARRG